MPVLPPSTPYHSHPIMSPPQKRPCWLEKAPDNFNVYPIGDAAVFIHRTAKAFGNGNNTVGRMSYISAGSQLIAAPYPITIGAFTSIAPLFYCHTNEDHDTQHISTFPFKTLLGMELDYPDNPPKPQGVRIGNDVWIGRNVRVMAGVTIGDGAVIAANAVVTKDIPPYTIYGGVPAQLIRYRCAPQIAAALLNIQWWDWPIEKIRKNTAFFNLNISQLHNPETLYQAIVE